MPARRRRRPAALAVVATSIACARGDTVPTPEPTFELGEAEVVFRY